MFSDETEYLGRANFHEDFIQIYLSNHIKI